MRHDDDQNINQLEIDLKERGKETIYDGKTYVAVPKNGCEGCAFEQAKGFAPGCIESANCGETDNDGQAIIWVLKE